jgi:hypothetical protein
MHSLRSAGFEVKIVILFLIYIASVLLALSFVATLC